MSRIIGKSLFIVGILVSVLAGLTPSSYWTIILIALGLIVGFINISEKEAEKFLIASISLLVIGTAGLSALILNGNAVVTTQGILNNFVSFVAAAALVVALKTVISLGEKDK
ncbi:MAG: hypothetical protein NTZ65_01895 [Candidatus Berkelbacteria bacterium]|nr:hypothetical protein [Candidatus Berkelbacteria bacterium]